MKNIAIIGMGEVGGYLGGKLSQLKDNNTKISVVYMILTTYIK